MTGVLDLLRAAQAALVPHMRVIPGTGEPGVLNEAGQVHDRIRAYLDAPPAPGEDVLVPRALLREAKLIAACFSSATHVNACAQNNPEVKAALLEEVGRADQLESELRAALTQPRPAPAGSVPVSREVVAALEAAISQDHEHGLTGIEGPAYPLILRELRAALARPAQETPLKGDPT